MKREPQDIDRLEPVFDDESLAVDAGLAAAAALADRLGLEDLVDETLQMSSRPGGANPGRKVLTLVMSMLAGGSHIARADRLRSESTGRVLDFWVMTPSTLDAFLRSFTRDHVRQLDEVSGEALGRAWKLVGGPGHEPVTVDVDSTIREVSGETKAGAAYGHTGQFGYHPLLAVRAGTGEVVACGEGRRGGAASISSPRPSAGCGGPEPKARLRCGPTPGSGPIG